MAKRQTFLKSLIYDKTCARLWYRLIGKTEGHRVIISLVVVLIVIYLARIIINTPAWPTWTNFNGKGVWDLADLILVPIVLALVAFFFNKRQKEQELELAKQERENDREIARERTRETALQNYLDKMTELLLPPNDLRKSDEDSEVRSIARSRTLTVLRSLDGERKGSVVQFLYEAGLINLKNIIVFLQDANLEGAHLLGAHLRHTNLEFVNLRNANLEGVDLEGANLRTAFLSGTKLSGANLEYTNLENAKLEYATLKAATLEGAMLRGAILKGANLMGANLMDAILGDANLEGANLVDAWFDADTIWPAGFDPIGAGAKKVKWEFA